MSRLKGFEIGFFKLKDGASEADMLEALKKMEDEFLSKEPDLIAHYTVKVSDALYADVAVAASKEKAVEICGKWESSPAACAFLELIEVKKQGSLDPLSFGDILKY